MSAASITHSQLGQLVSRHVGSLPRVQSRQKPWSYWPSALVFVVTPIVGGVAMYFADLQPASNVANALLAGTGVLGGFLFQVLAWIGSRIATIADVDSGKPLTGHEIDLIGRLDLARANIAYATLVSIVFAMVLGVVALLNEPPKWMAAICAALLFHLGVTLLLVLVRINGIAKDDRIAALTRHARGEGRQASN
jgi:hypothetical protein